MHCQQDFFRFMCADKVIMDGHVPYVCFMYALTQVFCAVYVQALFEFYGAVEGLRVCVDVCMFDCVIWCSIPTRQLNEVHMCRLVGLYRRHSPRYNFSQPLADTCPSFGRDSPSYWAATHPWGPAAAWAVVGAAPWLAPSVASSQWILLPSASDC